MRCNEVLFYSFQLENRTADYNRSWQVPAAFMLLHSQGSHAAVDHKGQCHRVGVIASALKRARQFAARKELQKQAKHEYLKQFYEVSSCQIHHKAVAADVEMKAALLPFVTSASANSAE